MLLLQVEDSLFGGGAPWSSAADLLPPPRSQLCGPAVRGFPLAGCRGTADLALTNLVQEADEARLGDDGVRWRRSSAAGDRRLPVPLGDALVPRLGEQKRRRATDGAKDDDDVNLQEGLDCNFVFRGDLSVIAAFPFSPLYPQKKKKKR